MKGSLILIAGRSGAGKTTLMRAAARLVSNVEILQTTTTRPRRPAEEDGREYVFVSDVEYETRRLAAGAWEHLEYHGHKYGADADVGKAKLARGAHLICTITPNLEAVQMLEKTYSVPAITIWLEVPAELAASRVAGDKTRAARIEDNAAKLSFQHQFEPTGVLAKDEAFFAAFVRSLLP